MFNRILVLAFAISITACSEGDLPDNSNAVSSASVMSAATPLALYSDSDSLYTGGVANLSVSGGTAPYTFSVDNATLGIVSGGVFTSLKAGTVNITVKDATGATAQHGIAISDAPTASTPPSNTKPIYRFRHDANSQLWHLFTPDEGGDPSYAPNSEGIQYHVYKTQVAGSVPFYQCRTNEAQTIRFNTLNDNCEGFGPSTRVTIGYAMVQSATAAGLVPLYRHRALLCPFVGGCYYARFDSLSRTPPSGFEYVGQIAMVPNQ